MLLHKRNYKADYCGNHKDDDHRIVILKSWNEWAEGNYVEPDLNFGRGYLEALRTALQKDIR